jgi:predicted dehydrogenase
MKTPGPELTQAWPRPTHPRPVVVVGAGAIVRTAHLPVYRRLGFPVAGVFDVDPEQARATARAFAIDTVFPSLRDALGVTPAVFDVAGPAIDRRHPRAAPARRAVLMQPMGQDLEQARRISRAAANVARRRRQLPARFSPGAGAARLPRRLARPRTSTCAS